MLLNEQNTVLSAALPLAEFKDHLALGTGFADDGAQNNLLDAYLRSAIAAIETRTGKVLIEKSYMLSLSAWREPNRQPLPLAPVSSVDAIRVLDLVGQASVVDPARYRLETDAQRPVLWATTGNLPSIATGGLIEVDLLAGYGPAWSDVPEDLQLATLILAAQFYENRAGSGAEFVFPAAASALIAPYRTIRLLGGGAG